MRRNGFTLVEATIVVVVIAAILAMLIPILRERERERLQAVADAEPWEVFDLRAKPVKETFVEGEDIVVLCEIVNLTGYSLTLPKDLDKFFLVFGETNYFVRSVPSRDPISRVAIAPEKLTSFKIAFRPVGTGVTDVRIAYSNDQIFNYRLRMIKVGEFVAENFPAIVRSDEKRFQSRAFQLVVKERISRQVPTFEEILDHTKQWEASH